MKANEAPEKIYLSDFTDTTESVFYVKQDNTKKTDFEYTRTDAFIEKACEWLKSKGGFTIGFDGATVKDFLDYINK